MIDSTISPKKSEDFLGFYSINSINIFKMLVTIYKSCEIVLEVQCSTIISKSKNSLVKYLETLINTGSEDMNCSHQLLKEFGICILAS